MPSDTQNHETQSLLVNRKDFSEVALVHSDLGPLEAGHIRVDIGPWALTANNVTYMVTGEHIGYWHYFEPAHYDLMIEEEGDVRWGRMPVWGYAKIVESRCEGLNVGTEIYGFFPVAGMMDLKPVKISPHGFQDGADHRIELHSVYNSYSLTAADPSFGGHRNLQPILRPLFTTSFLIDDFLARENFFGAEQVLLLSASSKTALGTAYCLKQRGDIKVTGLTSSGNKAFVQATGFYDAVADYDSITDLNADVKTAVVDMAGNGKVMATIYDHFEENILYNCMVGKSHWQGGKPPKVTIGAPPIMFFAPDQAKQRFADWGADGFAQKLGARWIPFCESAADWLTVENKSGIEPLLITYKDLLGGVVDPAKASLFTL